MGAQYILSMFTWLVFLMNAVGFVGSAFLWASEGGSKWLKKCALSAILTIIMWFFICRV